jgi:hypothetical protein
MLSVTEGCWEADTVSGKEFFSRHDRQRPRADIEAIGIRIKEKAQNYLGETEL